MRIMVTGANGFIGRRLTCELLAQGIEVTALLRRPDGFVSSDILTVCHVSSFDITQLSKVNFLGVDCLIHLAARAHILSDSSIEPLAEFRKVNTEATLHLARMAAASGVKRFIFLSSIGVNGISNTSPFTIFDKPNPSEHYAISKLEAEIGLSQISADTGMDLVIIRPPLVYGPNAPGNFSKLCKLTQKNLPLPLGAIHNKRSLVALDNLIDLIVTCIDHPNAANQTFLVSDDHDVSTTELLKLMICAVGKEPCLLPFPLSWLQLIGKLTGKQALINRLCGNLQVDISHTKQTLGWTPPITVEEGIARCFAAKG